MLEKLKRNLPIFLLSAGHGAVDFYIILLSVVAPGLAVHLDVPLGDIVFLIGVASLMNNVFQPITGYFMERRNLAWVLWAGIALSVLSAFMGFATGYWSLAVLILLSAIGTGIYHPEGALAANDASGDKAHLGVTLFMAGGACFMAFGTPLAIKITETWGFPHLAWLAAPGLAVAAVFFFQYRERKRRHPSVVLRPRSKRLTRVDSGALSYWPLLGAAICFGVSNGMFQSLLSSHFELNFGPSARYWTGWILVIMWVSGSVFSFVWSAVAHKRGFYKVTLLTQIAAVPLFILVAYAPSPEIGFALAIPLSAISPMAIYPMTVPMARNAAGLTQSMRTSILMGGTSGLSAIAVMFSGALLRWEVPSSHLMLFVAFCSVIAVALSVWQLLARKKTSG